MVDQLKILGNPKRVVTWAQVVPREWWLVVVVLMNAHYQVNVVDQVNDLVLMIYVCRYKNIPRGFWIPTSSIVLGKVVYGVFFFNWNRGKSVFFVSQTVKKDVLIEDDISQNEHTSSRLRLKVIAFSVQFVPNKNHLLRLGRQLVLLLF